MSLQTRDGPHAYTDGTQLLACAVEETPRQESSLKDPPDVSAGRVSFVGFDGRSSRASVSFTPDTRAGKYRRRLVAVRLPTEDSDNLTFVSWHVRISILTTVSVGTSIPSPLSHLVLPSVRVRIGHFVLFALKILAPSRYTMSLIREERAGATSLTDEMRTVLVHHDELRIRKRFERHLVGPLPNNRLVSLCIFLLPIMGKHDKIDDTETNV